MKLNKLKVNENNPQIFDDLHLLKQSIENFPKMMEYRPIVYDKKQVLFLEETKD